MDRRQPVGGLGQDLDLGRQVEPPRLRRNFRLTPSMNSMTTKCSPRVDSP
jgi:hypothetical protein